MRVRIARVDLFDPKYKAWRLIGHLSEYAGVFRMTFAPDYLQDADRPVLSQAFTGATEQATRQILSAQRDERLVSKGVLPAFFDNLLPEGKNRQVLAQAAGVPASDSLALLVACGLDLPGAVRIDAVNDTIPSEVGRWHASQGVPNPAVDYLRPAKEGFASLTGVQPKWSASISNGRRFTLFSRDPGTVILKAPQDGFAFQAEAEAVGLELAQLVGLTVPRHVVVPQDQMPEGADRTVDCLAIGRFDRTDLGPVHVEDMAQVFNWRPGHKYGSDLFRDYAGMLAFLAHRTPRPLQACEEFVRRFVAYILMGNVDAHFKNWAIVYPDGRHPELAPAYDVVPALACTWAGTRTPSPMATALDRMLSNRVTWEFLEKMARAAKAPSPARLLKVARKVVADAREKWPDRLERAPAPLREGILHRIGPEGVALAQLPAVTANRDAVVSAETVIAAAQQAHASDAAGAQHWFSEVRLQEFGGRTADQVTQDGRGSDVIQLLASQAAGAQ